MLNITSRCKIRRNKRKEKKEIREEKTADKKKEKGPFSA